MEKCYFCTITEINGEAEYTSSFLMKTDDIEKDLQEVFKNYCGDGEYDSYNGEEDTSFIWFRDLAATDSDYREVPEEDFNVLKKYLIIL